MSIHCFRLDEMSGEGDKDCENSNEMHIACFRVDEIAEESDKNSDVITNNNVNVDEQHVKPSVVRINVSGVTYELDIDEIRRAPSSRLCRLVCNGKYIQTQFDHHLYLCFSNTCHAYRYMYIEKYIVIELFVCPYAAATSLSAQSLFGELISI